jgi:hypothetical protein
MNRAELCAKMREFIEGPDRSIRRAGEIEVALDELLGEVEPFSSLVLALASYRPEGGEYLYSEEMILPLMRVAWQQLCAAEAT